MKQDTPEVDNKGAGYDSWELDSIFVPSFKAVPSTVRACRGSDDSSGGEWSLAAADESLVVTGPGEHDPLGLHISPSQPRALPRGPGASHCSRGSLFNAI